METDIFVVKEEIIKKVKTKMCKDCGVYLGGGKCSDNCSITKIIRVLKQEPCDDCISRAQALSDYADWYGYGYRDNIFYKHLKDMPPVTPQRETGCWIFVDKAHEHARCSKCDYGDVDLLDGKPHNYCPNCGAWITGAQEREEKA